MMNGNTASVDASTNPMETEDERLRRLTKAALKAEKPNKFGPKKQGDVAMDPDEIIHRAMHGVMKIKP